ncbi:MAG: Rab family GTPase [Candidatus Hodarchaeales archaeon]
MKYTKIILTGDIAVGKTSLINHFVTGMLAKEYKATIGVDIYTKTIPVNGQNVITQIWDIAGQTSFRKFRQKFFANAKGALLVYDVTAPKSLLNLHLSWINDILSITGNIPLVLVGNKIDLWEKKAVMPENVNNFLSQHPYITTHINTSALTGESVETAFYKIVSLLLATKPVKIL